MSPTKISALKIREFSPYSLPMQHSLSQLQILRKHLPIENGDQKWIRSYLRARLHGDFLPFPNVWSARCVCNGDPTHP